MVHNVRGIVVADLVRMRTHTPPEAQLRQLLKSCLRLCIAVAVGSFFRVVVASGLSAIQRGSLVVIRNTRRNITLFPSPARTRAKDDFVEQSTR